MSKSPQHEGQNLAQIALLVLLAAGLWFVTFGLPEFGNFWFKISLSAASLAIISIIISRTEKNNLFQFKPRHILLGLGSALALYGIFALGDWILFNLFPAFAPGEISNIYARREGTPPWAIAPLLLFVTGPSEEIFWRGFLQRRLAHAFGPLWGLLIATAIYSLVHIWTMNLSLLLAAFVAGLVWGLIYLRERSLVPGIISHAVWSAVIFVFLPLH